MMTQSTKRWCRSLKIKVTVALTFLVAISLLTIGITLYIDDIQYSRAESVKLIVEQQKELTDKLKSTLEGVKNDLSVLSDMPPIEAILRAQEDGGVDPDSQDSLITWQQRLEKIMAAYLRNRSIYHHLSFIDATGHTLMSMHVQQKLLDSNFNEKTHLDLSDEAFRLALNLKQGNFAYSIATLDRDDDLLAETKKGIINVFAPVYLDGKIKGVLTISMYVDDLLAILRVKDKNIISYVVDENDYFLIHPDASKKRDSNNELSYTLKDQFPFLFEKKSPTQLINSNDRNNDFVIRDTDSNSILAVQKIFFDGNNKRYWQVIYQLQDQVAFQKIYQNRNLSLISGSIILFLLIIVSAVFTFEKIIKPILKLAGMVEKLSAGDLTTRLDIDEKKDTNNIKILYKTFNAFADKQHKLKENLELKVESRTEYLSNIVTHLVDGLIISDEKGVIESCNPACYDIFGYSQDEMVGNNVKMLMPESFHLQDDDYLQKCIKTGVKKNIGIGQQVQGRRKDGSLFPLDLAVSEVMIEGERRYIGTVRDISKRKVIEQQLRQTDERHKRQYVSYFDLSLSCRSNVTDLDLIYGTVTENCSTTLEEDRISIWLFNEEGDKLLCQDLFDQQTTAHIKGQELVATDHPEYFAALKKKDGEVEANYAATDPLTRSFNQNYFIPNGITSLLDAPIYINNILAGILCIEHRGAPKAWAVDEILYVRAIANLVTFSLEDLDRRQVRETLAEKNEALEQANDMKTGFLANMSHELRTPLNAIIGFSEILKDGVLGQLTEEQTQYSQEIFDSGCHLLDLINDILDLSKIESGSMLLELDEVSLSDFLQSSLYIVREKAMQHSINLEVKVDENIDFCLFDIRKMKQIIYNLLSNAVKFTPEGGSVTMSAKRLSPQQLLIELVDTEKQFYEGDYIEISVTDTGIGIAEHDFEKVFYPFIQVDGTISRQYAGTGLGLSLVKSLVELHGGSINLTSKLCEGTTFKVYLPYKPADTDTDMSFHLALIIDNDPPSAALTKTQLQTYNIDSVIVESGEQAFKWLDEHDKPDLIVLELLLSTMRGWDFVQRIHTQFQQYADIPIIILSIIGNESIKRGYEMGAKAVLQKPVEKQELRKVIAKLDLITQAQVGD